MTTSRLRLCIAKLIRKPILIAVVFLGTLALGVRDLRLNAENAQAFPEGFDAVQAAPASHKVVFENAFIRVLHVTLPPPGPSEPMHYHRYPSLFLGYDTGGKTAHIRYHTPNGKVVDQPAESTPYHPGEWSADWMAPEPMHSIEVVESEQPGPGTPPGWLRIEIKCIPQPQTQSHLSGSNAQISRFR